MKITGKREWDLHKIRGPRELRALINDGIPKEDMRRVFFKTPVLRIEPDGVATLVAGKHSLAQKLRSGEAIAKCRIVECTDDELLFCSRADVLVDPLPDGAGSLHLLDLLEKTCGVPELPLRRQGPGRPLTPRGVLRVLVSTQTGVGRASIFVAESRRRAKLKDSTVKAERTRIDGLGMELEADFESEIELIQAVLENASSQVTSVSRKISSLRERSFPGPDLNALKAMVSTLACAIRDAMPASVCPFCKGLDGYMENCAHCLTNGWCSAGKLKHVPKDLLDANCPRVQCPDGTRRPVADVFAEQEEAIEEEGLESEMVW